MRWWDIGPVYELERDLFPEDAWSLGMFWSDLAHARGPRATRRYVVAEAGGTGSPDSDANDAKRDNDNDRNDNDNDQGDNDNDQNDNGKTGGGAIVGYAGLAAAGGLGDVLTIAVAREKWGTGLGARLLTDLLRHATAFECEEVLLEVRVDNTRAQKLYERFGFEPIGIRRGYYQPANVDALVMRLHVQGNVH
ncbi:ribosomal protein S18-alanine N-acetyltransferase [Streptomyces sp. NPDC004726]